MGGNAQGIEMEQGWGGDCHVMYVVHTIYNRKAGGFPTLLALSLLAMGYELRSMREVGREVVRGSNVKAVRRKLELCVKPLP